MAVPSEQATRDVPAAHIRVGDRIYTNGYFVQVVAADRLGKTVAVICHDPEGKYENRLYTSRDQPVTIQRLPHAHRYLEDGPIFEALIAKMSPLGYIIQSTAGIYVASWPEPLIRGEWHYGSNKLTMAYFDPSITKREAQALLYPIFGRRVTVVDLNGLLTVTIEEYDHEAVEQLSVYHPHLRHGSDEYGKWIYLSSLSIRRQ